MTAQNKTIIDDTGSDVVREVVGQLNDARGHATCGLTACANAGATTVLPLFYATEDSYVFDVHFWSDTALANAATDIAVAVIDDGDMTGAGIAAGDRLTQVQEFDVNNLTVDDLASMRTQTEVDGTAIGTTWVGALPARVDANSLVVLEVISTEAGVVNIAATCTYAPIKDEITLSGGGGASPRAITSTDR